MFDFIWFHPISSTNDLMFDEKTAKCFFSFPPHSPFRFLLFFCFYFIVFFPLLLSLYKCNIDYFLPSFHIFFALRIYKELTKTILWLLYFFIIIIIMTFCTATHASKNTTTTMTATTKTIWQWQLDTWIYILCVCEDPLEKQWIECCQLYLLTVFSIKFSSFAFVFPDVWTNVCGIDIFSEWNCQFPWPILLSYFFVSFFSLLLVFRYVIFSDSVSLRIDLLFLSLTKKKSGKKIASQCMLLLLFALL